MLNSYYLIYEYHNYEKWYYIRDKIIEYCWKDPEVKRPTVCYHIRNLLFSKPAHQKAHKDTT